MLPGSCDRVHFQGSPIDATVLWKTVSQVAWGWAGMQVMGQEACGSSQLQVSSDRDGRPGPGRTQLMCSEGGALTWSSLTSGHIYEKKNLMAMT